MKRLHFTFAFIFVSLAAQAQITLEHVYPFRSIKRDIIAGAGERYYALTLDTAAQIGMLHWFDSNHVPLNTTSFDWPFQPTNNVVVVHTSANFFDDDPGIEFVIWWTDITYTPITRVIDDDGADLSGDLNGIPSLFTLNNVNKVLADNKIYTVSGFEVEHDFSPHIVQTTVLEGEGRKFWYYEEGSGIEMLNDDYSYYATFEIDVDVPIEISLVCPSVFSCYNKYGTDSDEDIEWSYNYRCGDSVVYRFYSNSQPIFQANVSSPGVSSALTLTPYQYPDLNGAKVWISRISSGLDGFDSIEVYDVGSGIREHVFLKYWERTKSDISGLKYYQLEIKETQASFSILNSDYTTWADFLNLNNTKLVIYGMGEKLFDTDENTKEVLARSPSDSGFKYTVWRENGSVLFEADNMPSGAAVSRLPGLPNKLMIVSNPYGLTVPGSYVFNLPSASTVSTEGTNISQSLHFSASPNPFSDALQLDFSTLKEPVTAIRVTDITGRLVYQKTKPVENRIWTLPDADRWPQGIYFVQIRSGSGTGVQKIVRQ